MEENPEDNMDKAYLWSKTKKQCKHCDMTFIKKNKLKRHMKTVHGRTKAFNTDETLDVIGKNCIEYPKRYGTL